MNDAATTPAALSPIARKCLSFLQAHSRIRVPVTCVQSKVAYRLPVNRIESFCDEIVAAGFAVRTQVSINSAVCYQATTFTVSA